MTNTLEYIENYFSGNLSKDEKAVFEKKCETDPVFAEEVGFYIAARDSIRRELHIQKRKEFDEMYIQLSSKPVTSPSIVRRLFPYFSLAAACLLLFLGWLLLFNSPSPQQLASDYVDDNLQTLSITMSSSQDSLQLGIAAFNRKDYSSAEKLFQALSQHHTQAPEALKNLGIVYLVTGQYNNAVSVFDFLSNNKSLYSNPGPFYKAIALMKRNEGKDLEVAKEILQEVVEKQHPGSRQAEEWIEQW